MAIESFGYGMTDEQVAAHRRYKTDPHFPDTDNYRSDLDYEHEITNALDDIFGSSQHRLRRIIIVSVIFVAALLTLSFFAPFLQH